MSTQTIPAPVGTYQLGRDTQIRFKTKHLFGMAAVKGSLTARDAVIVVGDTIAMSAVTASVDAGSFTTRNPLRDIQVRSRLLLHARRHPTFEFRSQSIDHVNGAWHVRGTLEVRGKRAPVELTVDSLSTDDIGMSFRAHGEIDRYALGVSAFKGMAARQLFFEIDGRFTRS